MTLWGKLKQDYYYWLELRLGVRLGHLGHQPKHQEQQQQHPLHPGGFAWKTPLSSWSQQVFCMKLKKNIFLKTDSWSWMIGLKLLAMIPDLLDFMLMLKWKQNKKKTFFQNLQSSRYK